MTQVPPEAICSLGFAENGGHTLLKPGGSRRGISSYTGPSLFLLQKDPPSYNSQACLIRGVVLCIIMPMYAMKSPYHIVLEDPSSKT